jgi:hypothetical protein
VQILDGLEPGELVLLSPPKITESKDQNGSETGPEASSQDKDEIKPETQGETGLKPQVQSKSQPEGRQGRERRDEFELTDEKIDGMIGFLEQKNPEKAQELKQLRQSDPEKFKVEFRRIMQEQFDKGGRGERGGPGRQRQDGDKTSP